MIHFEHPKLLYLLLFVVVAVVFFVWMRLKQRRRLDAAIDSNLYRQLNPDESQYKPVIKFVLLLLAYCGLVFTLANPQVGTKMVKGERIGADIAICMDVSNSMMAEDITPNRLQRSQKAVSSLLDQLGSDRISIIAFAGSAYIQMPLSNDYGAAKMFVDQLNPDLIPTQGTAIGAAIEQAMASFGYGDPDREWIKKQTRSIIIISDGENHEDDAMEAAREAAREGVVVNTIGMGLDKGAPIPRYVHGVMTGYKKDRNGNTVTTKLNEQMMVDIAQAGGGIYVRANNINAGISEIVKQIEKLDKENYGTTQLTEYESQYQYPLAIALLCLLLEVLIMEKSNNRINWSKIIKRT